MTSLAVAADAEVAAAVADLSTRQRLVAEGLRAFSTVGYDGASVREIERAAGIGRGLVAHHFGTKDALWRECVDWLMGRFHDEFQEQQRFLADVSPHERARVLMKVYVRFAARHPEYTRLLVLSGDQDSERVRWMVDTWIKANFAFFNRISGTGAKVASRYEAMAVYAFIGASSMLFTLPVEARMVFGVDTGEQDFVEDFAELMVAWVGHEAPDDRGRIVSALDRAVGVAKQRTSGRKRR